MTATRLDLTQLQQLSNDRPKVLILGGQGRIGSAIARDVLTHTEANVIITGRSSRPPAWEQARLYALGLDLANTTAVQTAIAAVDLVVHAAGPFSYRDHQVLDSCIAQGIPYLDVADHPPYVKAACDRQVQAQTQNVTAIVGTGVFPGLSNSMARQAVEAMDSVDELRLDYVVAGSGGAGVTVLRTTFLELQHPIPAWVNGQWVKVKPYSQRDRVNFPAPYGRCGVYWFNTVEGMTLPASFPNVHTVITKFGSLPDFYNHLTWLMAHGLPASVLQNSNTVEFLAQVSYAMTTVTDRVSGTGLAMRAVATGHLAGQPTTASVTMTHPDTAIAAGAGTGSLIQAILAGTLQAPGVQPVERAVPTTMVIQLMGDRGISLTCDCRPSDPE